MDYEYLRDLYAEISEIKNLLSAKIENPVPDIMDMRQAAKYMSLSYDTVARLCRLGNLKYRKVGGKNLIKRIWVDEYMEEVEYGKTNQGS